MIIKYFGLIMAIFYFVMGIGILVLPYFDSVTDTSRYLVAAMLVLYGIIRFIRKLNEKDHDKQEP